MKRAWNLAAAGLAAVLIVSFLHPGSNPPPRFREAARKLDRYLERITPFGFAGAVLVAAHGQILLNNGYGMAVRSEERPNTSETVFSTGSITKQFTASGIMKLEMMGRLKTCDPISRFFDGVPDDKKGIMLHHLLTHTSGVVDAVGPDYEAVGREDIVLRILDSPLRFAPGEEFGYSNAGYSLLAAVIEKVSGQPYETFIHENLFNPAGMPFTGYRIPDWESKTVAHWYSGDLDNGTPLEKHYPYWNLVGNGGILSTTEDMFRWHMALLGDEILSTPAKDKMFTPFLNEYGYGWDVLQTPMGTVIQHDGGSTLGNSAEMRRYIDAGVLTVLFCNQSFQERPLFAVVRDKVERLVFGGEIELPPPVRPAETAETTTLVGEYILEGGGLLRIDSGGGLIVRSGDAKAAALLLGASAEDMGRYERLNSLSERIFEAAVKGDLEPLESVLARKEERLEAVRRLVRSRLNEASDRVGKVDRIRARTVPGLLNGQRLDKTVIELAGNVGSLYFGLFWKEGMNVGIGPEPGGLSDISVPFHPSGEESWAGYRLDTGLNIELRFVSDERGGIRALEMSTPSGLFRAVRGPDR